MPLRVLATNAPARFGALRFGALRFGALPELGSARSAVLGSMWFATVESISASLSVAPNLSASVQAQSAVSASLSIAPSLSASIQSQSVISASLTIAPNLSASIQAQTSISAALSFAPSISASVADGQLFLTFTTPDNRLVQLGFNARYMNQETWRFVGITPGNRHE